jgi:Family of unknown function (DUF5706)
MMDKDKLFKQLDKNDQWVQNADAKISIILIFLGVFSGFILSSKDLKQVFNLKWEIMIILTFVLFCLTALFTILGIWFAFKGIKASTKNIKSGLWFFGDVAKYKYTSVFIRQKEKQTDDEFVNDILIQIYNTAKIANEKFKRFNQSLNCTKWAVIFFVIFYFSKLF